MITSTLLAAAVCNPVSGRLGDLYGKRRVLLGSLGLMVIGSAVCALSDGLVPVVAGRVLQGCGIGVIPLGISIMRDELPPERLGSAMALMSATLGWTLNFGWPRTWQSLGGGWSAVWTQTGSDVKVVNEASSGSLPTGGSTTVGFVGNYSGPNVLRRLRGHRRAHRGHSTQHARRRQAGNPSCLTRFVTSPAIVWTLLPISTSSGATSTGSAMRRCGSWSAHSTSRSRMFPAGWP
ncbi:MFS transporter [Sphaerisporangium perillae]|uniref:MFS transporter n=1 Tax=Sphaerisporangium perillae TaxID=2935860 RepID=UPI0035572BCE